MLYCKIGHWRCDRARYLHEDYIKMLLTTWKMGKQNINVNWFCTMHIHITKKNCWSQRNKVSSSIPLLVRFVTHKKRFANVIIRYNKEEEKRVKNTEQKCTQNSLMVIFFSNRNRDTLCCLSHSVCACMYVQCPNSGIHACAQSEAMQFVTNWCVAAVVVTGHVMWSKLIGVIQLQCIVTLISILLSWTMIRRKNYNKKSG